jgi:hypothetical protein
MVDKPPHPASQVLIREPFTRNSTCDAALWNTRIRSLDEIAATLTPQPVPLPAPVVESRALTMIEAVAEALGVVDKDHGRKAQRQKGGEIFGGTISRTRFYECLGKLGNVVRLPVTRPSKT